MSGLCFCFLFNYHSIIACTTHNNLQWHFTHTLPIVAPPRIVVEVLRLYPEYQQEFSNDIQHDLTFNLREGYEAEAEESDMNGPSLALPSISEDDENQSDAEHVGSPRTAALLRSPLLLKSPRRKFLQRESSLTTLRERVERQRSVTVKSSDDALDLAETDSKSLEGLSLEKSGSYQDVNCAVSSGVGCDAGGPKQFDRLDSLHQDVAALSIEVRNAIQALQEMTYSRLASNVQLCGFPPARSIPNLGGIGCGGVGVGLEAEIVRSSSHPPEMWGREMGIFAVHPENPFQADIAAAAAAAIDNSLLLTAMNSVGTQTEEDTDAVLEEEEGTGKTLGGGGNNIISNKRLLLVEETILSNPEILLLLVHKHESLAQSAQLKQLAVEVIERTAASDDQQQRRDCLNGSKLVESSRLQGRGGNSGKGSAGETSRASSIINHSVQYYEEAEQKLLSVKSKLRRKLSSEKVRRRNHYNNSTTTTTTTSNNDSSGRMNGLPVHRFSAGDADYAEIEVVGRGVRANQSTRSLKDN